MESMHKTKKKLLLEDSCLSKQGGWVEGGFGEVHVIESDCKFEITSIIGNYKGNNLDYDMLCEPTRSYHEKKEGFKLTGDHLDSLHKLTTKMNKFILCQQQTQEKDLQVKTEEDHCEISSLYQKNGIRKIHHDFNFKNPNAKQLLVQLLLV